MSEFQSKVYSKLMEVSQGEVTTYGDLAKVVGGGARAVGNALRENPFAPKVPCHRVVSASGKIGGFCGEIVGVKITEKIKLLEREGVRFENGKCVNFEKIRHKFKLI